MTSDLVYEREGKRLEQVGQSQQHILYASRRLAILPFFLDPNIKQSMTILTRGPKSRKAGSWTDRQYRRLLQARMLLSAACWRCGVHGLVSTSLASSCHKARVLKP